MKIDVYCDEAYPDLLTSKNPQAQYMILGSLWLKSEDRPYFKESINKLKKIHKVGGEFKWQKVSPSRREFYHELIEWFWEQGERLRFRCIVIDREDVDLIKYHLNDQELGFYKFYYQLLHHWIRDFNDYSIFCDYKLNRRRDRLKVLMDCLDNSNLSSQISHVQAIRSNESVLIQLTDLLIGVSSERLNGNSLGGVKKELLQHMENLIGHNICQTSSTVKKFNVFKINLQGGF